MTGNADPEAVRSYYEYVDSEAYEALFDLFSPDITYVRSGPRELDGIDELREFYLQERPLRGEHTVDDLLVDGDRVAVRGRYEGRKLTDGEEITFGFADFLRFDDDGKIVERNTFNNMLAEQL
ncbi:nuclear transport factor 2 family protein [Halorarius litoreus]|uniref:nuclear transport factor 2 family protein n=1 Tax=Halorarius litoreus TaxID=2962676 RepID=UPI0020CCE535|nr:nuclear transport factor 2 family protein [Halorarius litoreus]